MNFFATRAGADDAAEQDLSPAICSALIALPFLFPFAAGPSVNVWQQLASWLCVALLLLLVSSGRKRSAPHPWVTLWLATIAVLIFFLRSAHLGAGPWLSAGVAVAATGLAASVGSGLVRTGARMQDALAWGLFCAGVVSAVLGLLQYYGLAHALVPWTTAPEVGQAFGNLRQRNQFASLISMALIAALWLYAGQFRHASPRRFFWAVAVVLLVVAAAASTSRTGLLQFVLIIGAAVLAARRERRNKGAAATPAAVLLPPPRTLLFLIPLYFVAAWLLPQLAGAGAEGMLHRLSEGAPSGYSRATLWRNVLTLIAERPWTGWGWGELGFAHYSHGTLYPGPRFVEILDNAHNLPLHLAVELGIPAAVWICGGFLWLVITARPWRERAPLRVMVWGLLGVIVLHSLLEYPLWYGPFQLVFGLCLGMLWPAPDRHTGPMRSKWLLPESALRRLAKALPSLSAAALGVVVVYAGWDYIRISQIYLPRDERLPAYEDDTLAKLQPSWLFANQVRFAQLALTAATRANALEVHALAEQQLHFSSEPRVIAKLIESAELLGSDGEARAQAACFKVAFPAAYARWLAGQPAEVPAP